MKSVVRPSPKCASALIEAVKTLGGGKMETSKRVGFRPAVIIEVPSWKEDTRRMNFSGLTALKTAWPRGEPCTLAANNHHDRGLGHHGDPEEEEVIVLEEPERPSERGTQSGQSAKGPHAEGD